MTPEPKQPAADFADQLIAMLPRLRRFAHALTGSAADADDVVQTGCIRALRGQASWQRGTRLDSWLFRILQNIWRDELRRRKARPEGSSVASGSRPGTRLVPLPTRSAAIAVPWSPARSTRPLMSLTVMDWPRRGAKPVSTARR